jgi:hypothetical protein
MGEFNVKPGDQIGQLVKEAMRKIGGMTTGEASMWMSMTEWWANQEDQTLHTLRDAWQEGDSILLSGLWRMEPDEAKVIKAWTDGPVLISEEYEPDFKLLPMEIPEMFMAEALSVVGEGGWRTDWLCLGCEHRVACLKKEKNDDPEISATGVSLACRLQNDFVEALKNKEYKPSCSRFGFAQTGHKTLAYATFLWQKVEPILERYYQKDSYWWHGRLHKAPDASKLKEQEHQIRNGFPVTPYTVEEDTDMDMENRIMEQTEVKAKAVIDNTKYDELTKDKAFEAYINTMMPNIADTVRDFRIKNPDDKSGVVDIRWNLLTQMKPEDEEMGQAIVVASQFMTFTCETLGHATNLIAQLSAQRNAAFQGGVDGGQATGNSD